MKRGSKGFLGGIFIGLSFFGAWSMNLHTGDDFTLFIGSIFATIGFAIGLSIIMDDSK